ncbi:DUF2017 family protein [Microbacterium sp. BK668]|uniref:DUF2017 family protein n=1 Tax=Microbacterium sp. BK668 TaxID=2512118 RepID=UPI001061B101|nr:DUF2017 family protein [Microbacterium sp. BK668]TDN92733.1 uncharacterized protein DUF2017 [Microbacterium sp. BK668]
MNPDRVVVLELSRLEATHLAGLVTQFAELLDETGDGLPDDPAVLRIVPDGYSGDPAAAQEFRELTQRELLERRSTDAAAVLADLAHVIAIPADTAVTADDDTLLETALVRLDADGLQAWLRTLAAIRLVLASRLGITSEEDHDDEDPRFGVYDWIGYRLDGLVRAADSDD